MGEGYEIKINGDYGLIKDGEVLLVKVLVVIAHINLEEYDGGGYGVMSELMGR